MKKITLLSVLLAVFVTISFAQRKESKVKQPLLLSSPSMFMGDIGEKNKDIVKSKRRRAIGTSSLVFATGTNQFMGELGGGKKDAAHFLGVRDLDFTATRPTWQVAYRYKFPGRKKEFLKFFSVRANFDYAFLSGKDKRSGALSRQRRNLSFISNTYSLNGQLEYYFIPEKARPRYAFSSLKGTRNISAFFFVGVGGLYFNPKARLGDEGKFTALRPLGTEGQRAPEGFTYTSFYVNEDGIQETLTVPKMYSRFAGVISIGLGAKYAINRQWAIGLEISNRYTSSDYLDDVHDRYFNYDDFPELGIDQSPFADRHLVLEGDWENGVLTDLVADDYHSGKTMRGNPNYNDAYILTMITVHYTLKGKRGRGSGPKLPGRRL